MLSFLEARLPLWIGSRQWELRLQTNRAESPNSNSREDLSALLGFC